MDYSVKHRQRNWLKSIFNGMKMLYLPVFSSYPQKMVTFDMDTRTDKEKLYSDYQKSTKEISKGVRTFEQLHRK